MFWEGEGGHLQPQHCRPTLPGDSRACLCPFLIQCLMAVVFPFHFWLVWVSIEGWETIDAITSLSDLNHLL